MPPDLCSVAELRRLNDAVKEPWLFTWDSRLPVLRLSAHVRERLVTPRPHGPVIAVHVFTDGSSKQGGGPCR